MKDSPTQTSNNLSHFDEHAVAIAKRQYFQPGDGDLEGMFRRVADWVAEPEGEAKEGYAERFYELMASKRFCPGGRVLAGAATQHGNVLNCFVQDGAPEREGSDAWVLRLATKLALVTKVGGGNGLCLDPLPPKRPYRARVGRLFLSISPSHPDYEKVKAGTYMDLVHGKYVTKGYRHAAFVEQNDTPAVALAALEIGDSVESIWRGAGEMISKLLKGEDVLLELSQLRAEGTPVKGSGGTSSGPSSFAVEVFDNFAYWASLGGAEYAGPVATLRYIYAPTLRVIRQGGTRRGAGMATMSISHPDIQDFITCKDLHRESEEGDISTFNISVLVSDEFMREQKNGMRGTLHDIADHAWQTGEPGLIFIDRINEFNPMLESLGEIRATNPCGEIPLFPGEPCDLGAINLSQYVTTPNRGWDGFDVETFRSDVKTCIRFLDNVLEVNCFALEDNREMSMRLRRLGLGIMGLADALIRMGYRYDSTEGREAVQKMITELRESALLSSRALAEERGAFPDAPRSTLSTPRRNVALLTVAPTGTTSMLMGVSSGVEPIFAPFIYRKIGDSYAALISPLFREMLDEHPPHPDFAKGDAWDWERVVEAVQANHGSVQGLTFIPEGVRRVLVCAHDISPSDHVKMQGTVQRTFDGGGEMAANSISKTINLPNEATVGDVYGAYSLAFDTGCKGITVYRDGSRDFQVLSTSTKQEDQKTPSAPVAAKEIPRLPGEPLFDRPGRLTGFTDNVKLTLPNGDRRSFYVTVNKQDDLPTEVFINAGKAGDESNADSEALGRVVSIALQYGVPAEAVVKTLRGINGGMYGSYGGRMVASKADLIAVALETAGVENVLNRGVTCPDCGNPLRFEEGCQKCEGCGYSKCG